MPPRRRAASAPPPDADIPSAAASRLASIVGAARVRNGRLDVDWLSRALRPRWRMVLLNGQWYDREGLRERVRDRGPEVPGTRRPLSAAEREDVDDPNPWSLAP